MTKATEAGVLLFFISAVYIALYSRLIPSPTIFHDDILPFLPIWSIVSLGSYSLWVLGYRVLTFKDKPEKYQELLKQIDEAKEFYRAKGVALD